MLPLLFFALLLIASPSLSWKQDRFVVSFWVDPIVPASEFDFRYKEIAEANFTVILGGFGATTPELVDTQIQVASKYGLASIVSLAGLPVEKLSMKAWGYQIADEPSAPSFPALGNLTASIAQHNPPALSFINLLPNYGNFAWGTKTYDEYVSLFVTQVRPQILSMDHYPTFPPDADTREQYSSNMATLRKYALPTNIPIWNFFASMPFDAHRDVTEEQIQWQVYTSLAYGAKGVLYFCYWTPVGASFSYGGAIITPTGTAGNYIQGPHYRHAKTMNAILVAWGPLLLNATSTGVYRITSADVPSKGKVFWNGDFPVFSAHPNPYVDAQRMLHVHDYYTHHAYIQSLIVLSGSRLKNTTAGNFLVGQLSHATGTLIFVNNWEVDTVQWPTLTFDVDMSQVYEISKSTGKPILVQDDSPLVAGLQIRLEAGSGRLFLLH